jgi:hypothetical protein
MSDDDSLFGDAKDSTVSRRDSVAVPLNAPPSPTRSVLTAEPLYCTVPLPPPPKKKKFSEVPFLHAPKYNVNLSLLLGWDHVESFFLYTHYIFSNLWYFPFLQ